MRSRLGLHLPLAEARTRFAHALVAFVGLEPAAGGAGPVPAGLPATRAPATPAPRAAAGGRAALEM